VLDGPRSLVVPQAANRVCAAQAVLRRMLLDLDTKRVGRGEAARAGN
jgi:hypothetical protein